MERTTWIQICGPLVVKLRGKRVEQRLPGRQGRLLFAYLAAAGARPASRDELLDAIWPEGSPAAADGALSALLSKLRQVLGSPAIEGRTTVQLRLPDDAWVDLEAAREALHRAESALARGDWPQAYGAGRVPQHVAVRGFLGGEAAPWIEAERRRLESMYLRSLEIVTAASLRLGGAELATAERAASALAERAPYRESGHRLLMEVLHARGDTAEALRCYERLRVLLREELGVAPSEEAKALHRRLLAS